MRSIDLSDNRQSDAALRMRKKILNLSGDRARCIISGNKEQEKRLTADIETYYFFYKNSKKMTTKSK